MLYGGSSDDDGGATGNSTSSSHPELRPSGTVISKTPPHEASTLKASPGPTPAGIVTTHRSVLLEDVPPLDDDEAAAGISNSMATFPYTPSGTVTEKDWPLAFTVNSSPGDRPSGTMTVHRCDIAAEQKKNRAPAAPVTRRLRDSWRFNKKVAVIHIRRSRRYIYHCPCW